MTVTNEIQLHGTQTVDIDGIGRVAKILALSGYFAGSGNMDQQVAQIGTRILAGQEMGFGPFASNNGIHIIKGNPSAGSNMMASAVKAHPKYDYRIRRMENDGVSIEFFELGESLGVSTFTADDAKAAGTQNMGKYPRNMLFARAMSNGVRWYCPDTFNGNSVYTPDELGHEAEQEQTEPQYTVVNDDGEIVQDDGRGTPIPELAPVQVNGPAFVESLDDAPEDTAAHVATPPAKASNGDNPFDDDGWGNWATMDDFKAAGEWAASRGNWKARKHLNNAWLKCKRENDGDNNPAEFMAAWRIVVNDHASQPVAA